MRESLKEIRKSYTFRLRKQPQTFLEGFASVLGADENILNKYNTDSTDEEADRNALNSDWKAVGQDMYSALKKYGK